MIYNANQNITAQKVADLPDWYFVTFEAINPGDFFVANTQQDCENIIAGQRGAKEVVSPTIFQTWWKGPIWVYSANQNTQLRILIPGYNGGIKS